MKFKHVLFSGLLMSTVFVACTNEEFQENGNQVSMKDAISLGEGFTITGGIMNAQTRAIYQDETSGTAVKIKSLWEPNDSIGAAWYAAYTGPNTGFLFNTNNFASNHPYDRVDKEGNVAKAEFETVTNSFAGKYVLYFPYDRTIAATAAAIPVKSETAQTMDVAKPLEHVNKNMFFYQNQEYTAGGNQIADFELKPVPVLYRLSFKANETTRALVGKVISKVVIAAESNLYSDGELKVSGANYKDAKPVYAGKTAIGVYTLDVTGNETDTDYQVSGITADGGMKKPFYISVLPANSEIAKMTFKVVTSDGLVFEKEIDFSGEGMEGPKTAITSEGGLFSNNITLDKVGEADGAIYTTQQFNKAWEAALKAGKAKTITLGAPMSLETLSMNETGSMVTIEGDELTVGTLDIEDGELTVDKLKATDVNIAQYGKLTTSNATAISGTLTIKGKDVTLGGVESLNNVLVERQGVLDVTGAAATKKITGTFTSNVESDVTLKDIVLDGVTTLGGIVSTNGVTFNKATTLNNKAELTAAGTTTFVGDVTNNGTIANTGSDETINFNKKLTNAGTITIAGTGVTFKGTTANTGTVTVGAAATNSGTFTNRGALALNAALTNAATGTLTLDKNPTGTADITNNGTVNVNAADVEASGAIIAVPAALNIVNTKNLTINIAKDKNVTFTKLTNSGTVNIERGTVKETTANAITQTAGEITVVKGAKISFTATHTDFVGGYLIIQDTKANALENAATQKAACLYADIATATDADFVIFTEKVSLTSDEIAVVQEKSLVLRADLELQDDMEMAANTSFIVEKEVTLTGKSSNRTLTFNSTSTTLEVKSGALLKVGTNATLNASSVITSNANKDGYGAIVAVGGEYTPKSE